MKTKYTIINAVGDERIRMLMYGWIGQAPRPGLRFIEEKEFADELYWHASNGSKVVCYINSYGGGVWAGHTMIQTILDCKADTHVVGVAASMGAIIAMYGGKRTCNDFAQEMFHRPSGGPKQVLDQMTAKMEECLINNCKFSKDEVTAMMKPGTDTWLDSSDMYEKGTIDEKPLYTGKKIIRTHIRNAEEIYNICSQLNEDQPRKDMKTIAAALGLQEEASDASIMKALDKQLNVVAELEQESKTLKAENKTFKEKQEVIEAAMKSQREQSAKALVDTAISGGKVKEESRAAWMKIATDDFVSAKTMLDGLVGKSGSVQMRTSVEETVIDRASLETSEEETYEFLAQYNPKKLRDLFENDPAKFNKLTDSYNVAKQIEAAKLQREQMTKKR